MKCLHYFKTRSLRETVVIYRFLSAIQALISHTPEAVDGHSGDAAGQGGLSPVSPSMEGMCHPWCGAAP